MYMYIVLLSGGSGKRLWPLSNDLRSKQYIKLTNKESSDEQCSMIQRVWEQLKEAGLEKNTIITASAGQVEIIRSQLGDVNIAVEPDRRDTFPAIALSCAYLKSKLGANANDYVCILPVDPYTERSYFESVKQLETILDKSDADIALMGAIPRSPSSKFGYIIPEMGHAEYKKVKRFKEKPSYKEAEILIQQGALWNCGVFCLKISRVLDSIKKYKVSQEYDGLYKEYDLLPRISFDYEVLEKGKNLIVTAFDGYWKDLGSWSSLTNQMTTVDVGRCIVDKTCKNTHVVNELEIPVVTIGTEDLIVVASFDGILVSDKNKSARVKDILKDVRMQSMYEERRWGTLKTLDLSESEEGFTLLRKILIFAEMSSSYHYHNERDEAITILKGRGEMIIDGVKISLIQGTSIAIPRGKKHAIKAYCDLEYMEIHIGKKIGDEDINRITFNWNEIGNS